MRWKTLIFAAVALIVVAVLLSFFRTAAWIGHFPLTIVVHEGETLNVDRDNVLFAACWREFEAEFAKPSGQESGVAFYSADEVDDNRFTVHVKCYGRSGPFEDSYVHPKYMVVQYSVTDKPASIQRKIFEIPAGRGERVVRVSLR